MAGGGERLPIDDHPLRCVLGQMAAVGDDHGDGFADEALQQKYGFEEPKCCCMSKLAHKIMCHFSFWSWWGCSSLCFWCFPFWWPVTAFYCFLLNFYWCIHAFGRCCVGLCNKEA